MRTPKILTAVALVASTLTAGLIGSSTATAASTEVPWCNPTTPIAPCIQSATVDTGAGATDIRTMSGWEVQALADSGSGSNEIRVALMRDSSYQLGSDTLDDTVVVKVLTGSLIPRVVTGKAKDTEVVRAGSGSAQEVTVTGKPVVVSGYCDQSVWPWTCTEFDETTLQEGERYEFDGYFDFQVSDYGTWDDATQRAAFYGMNYFTNVVATSIPPEITDDPATGNPMLLIRMANSHFRQDGTTVVKGRGELRIPNAFLKEVYGIPDPSTMSGTSLTPSLSGSGPGTVTSAQEPGDKAMLVTYDNVEFSARQLRIRTGQITPTRPTQVSAWRTSARRGFVDFEPSDARGAKVTGYAGRCEAVRGDHVVTGSSDNIVRFTGLRKGVAYDCKVRAKSEAGPSKSSEVARMGAKVVDVS